ncbi:carbohydrate-binding protein [Streptomyces atratus]
MYGSDSYRCLQPHLAQPGWTPPNVPAPGGASDGCPAAQLCVMHVPFPHPRPAGRTPRRVRAGRTFGPDPFSRPIPVGAGGRAAE